MKFENKKVYKCILSKSPGYTVGELYTCYLNSDGKECFKAKDGHVDLCSKLVSKFQLMDVRQIEDKSKLKVVR